MSSAPPAPPRRLRRALFVVLAVLAYLMTASILGTWLVWPPRPYVTLPGSEPTSTAEEPAAGDLLVGNVAAALVRPVPRTGVGRIEFSHNGRLIAGVKGETVLVWETATGRLRFTLPADASATGVLFCPDDRLLAVRGDRLRLFDLDTGAERPLGLPDPAVSPAAFSPDGKTLLVTARDSSLSLLDLATGELWSPAGLRMQPDPGNQWSVEARAPCQFSPDGRWLLWQEAGTMRVLDVAGRRELAAYTDTLGFAFAPDGEAWAVAVDKDVRVCAAPSGDERTVLRGERSPIVFLAWSPDGRLLASVVAHAAPLDVRLWDVREGAELAAAVPIGSAGPLRFSPDGRFLCAAGHNGAVDFAGTIAGQGQVVPLWDVRAAPPRHVASASSEELLAPDGRALATLGDPPGPVKPWTIIHKVRTSTWVTNPQNPWPRFTPDGKLLILSGNVTTVRGRLGNWLVRGAANTDSYQYKWVDTDAWHVRAVLDTEVPGMLSPDGRLLATGGTDRPVQLWHVPPRRPAGPGLVLVGLIGVLAAALVVRRRFRRTGQAPPTATAAASPGAP
jgi:WD40 repeat protein